MKERFASKCSVDIAAYEVEENDRSRSGQRAGVSVLFGSFHRYKVYPIHTRFDGIQWFVEDAMSLDYDNSPIVIRQNDDFRQAVDGLGWDDAETI